MRPLLLLALFVGNLAAQPTPQRGSAELTETLDKLQYLGSVLMMAAHPDDENTAVISYLARGRHMRTAYLSANRGEGGQNLIGTEQGPLMGMIRTQELLAARRVDGGEQFFTRVIDFGYSKTPEEALKLWGRDVLLGDMVRVIRQFQPDVIIARFAPPPGSGGHGQHTAVGHTGPAAFEAAGDPNFRPELGEPWQAKRYLWNIFQFGRGGPRALRDEPLKEHQIRIEIGDYDPVLGKSYAEIAGESRSMHRSQAMGSSQSKGRVTADFQHVAGDEATQDLFDGVDTSWGRISGGETVGEHLAAARKDYDPRKPSKILPHLLAAWTALGKLDGHWPTVKRHELARAIELASGLWLDATASDWAFAPGETINVRWTALNRSDAKVEWAQGSLLGVGAVDGPALNKPLEYNRSVEETAAVQVPADAAYSQPPWMREKSNGFVYKLDDPALIGKPEAPPVLTAVFQMHFAGGIEIPISKPVLYRWVDRSFGERQRALQIVPPVAVSLTRDNLIFPTGESRPVAVQLEANMANANGSVSLKLPKGWRATPSSIPASLAKRGQKSVVEFTVTPPATTSGGTLRAVYRFSDQEISTGMLAIEYDHIPIQMVYPPAEMRIERTDVKMLSKSIGYVMGAGDKIPEALRELGAEVALLDSTDLSAGDLSRYDAIVAGVRALNTRPDLIAAKDRLLEYVEQGGTLIEQYNTFGRRGPPPSLSPYPVKHERMSRARTDRVTDEGARVTLPLPDHALLQAPNRITEKDFDGWVQERGLYFMGEWDERFDSLFESNDEGQEPTKGGMLYVRHGKGVYIFSGYSWFRQLPAGVPGAYRIFANMVSASKLTE